MTEPELLVICYNCGETIPKSKAMYIGLWDVYYCEDCYCDLAAGKPVNRPNWRKRGI